MHDVARGRAVWLCIVDTCSFITLIKLLELHIITLNLSLECWSHGKEAISAKTHTVDVCMSIYPLDHIPQHLRPNRLRQSDPRRKRYRLPSPHALRAYRSSEYTAK
ncbi:hypothetical protein GMOD_00008594 [Pyrenophora seminiperda CCB06]|uniref:Uncharacterized protein n=1 Tax=Pyrenophora seminiperda CCB06 TaxID=1302712 RepID=A0A3M7M8Y9_9PLEO|nr:hypothetical protein GMOD_00008594 [Pyrenophora seminiperda CCB06]